MASTEPTGTEEGPEERFDSGRLAYALQGHPGQPYASGQPNGDAPPAASNAAAPQAAQAQLGQSFLSVREPEQPMQAAAAFSNHNQMGQAAPQAPPQPGDAAAEQQQQQAILAQSQQLQQQQVSCTFGGDTSPAEQIYINVVSVPSKATGLCKAAEMC